jgi:hypothetical protein
MFIQSFNKLFYTIVLISAFTSIAYSQISPGDLTNAHANLEGLSNCTKCHELGEKVDNEKCLECHTEIKSLQYSGSGYHSNSEVKNKNCWDCHSEHHGRKFRIINFDPNSFNHSKAGYKLEGAHAETDCDKCHQSIYISDFELKGRSGTYLGLNKYCFSCHEDYHQTSLGDNCAECHNTFAFKPAKNFNHNDAHFKLTGAHKNVDCAKCHLIEKRNGKDFQVFKGITFTTCQSCHKDVHQGKFGANCNGCHNTISFKRINKGAFNHDKTNFPLIGKHSLVVCESCHKHNLKTELKHENCTDCHNDYHDSQFTINEDIRDCKDCHSELGFRPSVFSLLQHDSTRFAITGAHLATPCESCHLKEEKWSFKKIGINCIDCHANIHEEELKEKFMFAKDCTNCHKTDSWDLINFDHNITEFKLFGKHSNISCGGCHVKQIGGQKQILFRTIDSDCETCHTDIHNGQFISENNKTDCSRCHSFDNWKPDKFDHNLTEFPLDGAHKNVDCSKCHPKQERNGSFFIKFKLESFKCADCHT